MSERLWFNCGKPGHAAAQCPEGKGLKVIERSTPDSVHAVTLEVVRPGTESGEPLVSPLTR